MGHNQNLCWISSVANGKSKLLPSWMGPAPTWVIGWCLCDNVAATTQLPHHGLAWILMVSWADLKLQDGLHLFAWRRSCWTIKLACLRGCMCIFLRWLWHALNRCLEHQCMCRYVHFTDVCWHQFTYLETHPPPTVHVHSCIRSLFINVGGRVWGGSASH